MTDTDERTGLRRIPLSRVNALDAWDLHNIGVPLIVTSENIDMAVIMPYSTWANLQDYIVGALNRAGALAEELAPFIEAARRDIPSMIGKDMS